MSEQTLSRPTIRSKELETLEEPVIILSALEVMEAHQPGASQMETLRKLVAQKVDSLPKAQWEVMWQALNQGRIVVTEETHRDALSVRVLKP